ncbi:MAG: hypothetical protein FWC00_04690 [Firmicutes bacterium]|nr:hypothetical protein [Bacillota bacterium]
MPLVGEVVWVLWLGSSTSACKHVNNNIPRTKNIRYLFTIVTLLNPHITVRTHNTSATNIVESPARCLTPVDITAKIKTYVVIKNTLVILESFLFA